MYETELDTVAFAIDTVQYILIGISWHQLLIETNVNVFDFFSAFWLLETSPLRALLIWFDYVVLGLGHGAALMLYLFLRWWRNTRLNRRRDEDGEDAVEERAPLLI